MSRRLTLQEAEALALRPVATADVQFIQKHYRVESFVRPPSLDAFDPKQPLDLTQVKRLAKEQYDRMSPLAKKYTSLDLVEKAVVEHSSSDNELCGDWPARAKKWALWILADHVEQLADVAVFAFRLDDLNARTVPLPSGTSGIILNTSLLALPYAATALLNLYRAGTAKAGEFTVTSSPDTSFLIRCAKYMANPTPDDFSSLILDHFQRYGLPTDLAMQIGIHSFHFVALHECAHLVEGYPTFIRDLPSGSVLPLAAMPDAWRTEIIADCFALESFLDIDERSLKTIDEESRNIHQDKVAIAVALLFAILMLKEAVTPMHDNEHPPVDLRWRYLRWGIVYLADPLLAKRLDYTLTMLRVMQQFKVY